MKAIVSGGIALTALFSAAAGAQAADSLTLQLKWVTQGLSLIHI